MTDNTKGLDRNDEDILTFDLPDEALEAAAGTTPYVAMSFPAAPTVSILVVCCGND
jgi:hypothetical protein